VFAKACAARFAHAVSDGKSKILGCVQEGAVLPDRGKAVTDQQTAEDMLADLEEQRPDIEENQ